MNKLRFIDFAKSVVVVACMSLVAMYFMRDKHDDEVIVKEIKKTDSIDSISYSIKMPSGKLELTASAITNPGATVITIKNIVAEYVDESGRKIFVKSEDCEVDKDASLINLRNNVFIKTDDAELKTSESTINIKTGELKSDQKVEGKHRGMIFEATGFYLARNKKLDLKNVKIVSS